MRPAVGVHMNLVQFRVHANLTLLQQGLRLLSPVYSPAAFGVPIARHDVVTVIMRPEPSPAGGSLDEVCMVLRDAAVVNRGQFGCGRDGLDRPELPIVPAE